MWNRRRQPAPSPRQPQHKQGKTTKPAEDADQNGDEKLTSQIKNEKAGNQSKDNTSETVRKRTKKVS